MSPVGPDDADAIFAYRSDAVNNQYQGWIPKTVNEVDDFIRNWISSEFDIAGTWCQLAIIKKEDHRLIGDIGIHFMEDGSFQVELGYTLEKDEQGKGYATEALTATINYLFLQYNKRRITASIDPRNTKSIALIERLGFRKEAHFRESLWINGEWVDDVIYALLKYEWKSGK